jgi:hypothetical protein
LQLFDAKKDPHNENIGEYDMNKVLYMMSPGNKRGASPTLYRTYKWQIGLRGDVSENIKIRKIPKRKKYVELGQNLQ